jgi:hypothetical protein
MWANWYYNVIPTDTAWLMTNQTGVYVKQSSIDLNGINGTLANFSFSTNYMTGKTVCWKIYANDTANGINNVMPAQCFYVEGNICNAHTYIKKTGAYVPYNMTNKIYYYCRRGQKDCDPYYQTDTYSIFKMWFSNSSCSGTNILGVNVNETVPSGYSLFCGVNLTGAGSKVINPAYTDLYHDLAINTNESVWCWMNYTNPSSAWYFKMTANVYEA